MDIQQQVTNLELSKKLKELRVKQESLFKWIIANHPTELEGKEFLDYSPGNENYNETPIHEGWSLTSWPAFTASELLEMLPSWTDIVKIDEKDYVCNHFKKNSDTAYHLFDENICNTLAKMLIHLIEKGIIEV